MCIHACVYVCVCVYVCLCVKERWRKRVRTIWMRQIWNWKRNLFNILLWRHFFWRRLNIHKKHYLIPYLNKFPVSKLMTNVGCIWFLISYWLDFPILFWTILSIFVAISKFANILRLTVGRKKVFESRNHDLNFGDFTDVDLPKWVYLQRRRFCKRN